MLYFVIKLHTMAFFPVDTSEAGVGDLDVKVICEGQTVNSRVQEVEEKNFHFSFAPNVCSTHTAEIAFNFDRVPGR